MDNPLRKNDHTGLITLLSFTAVAAGAAYLYLTKSGAHTRKSVRHKLKDKDKDLASGAISRKTGISKETLRKIEDFIVK